MEDTPILVVDSVTTLDAAAHGAVLVGASHCGAYAAYLAAKAGARAVLLNDAGIGRERAGVGGLALLQAIGRPAAAYGHRTARIGMAADAMGGRVTCANAAAVQLGVIPGQTVADAARRLQAAPPPAGLPDPVHEARFVLVPAGSGGPAVVAIDSASLIAPADAGCIVACGSHGGLLGGVAATALKYDAFAALFNDADGGLQQAGLTRLPALQARGIAAGTVSAWSARIGDGRSVLHDGFVTHQNQRAAELGGQVGLSAQEWVACMRRAARDGR